MCVVRDRETETERERESSELRMFYCRRPPDSLQRKRDRQTDKQTGREIDRTTDLEECGCAPAAERERSRLLCGAERERGREREIAAALWG